MLFFIIYHFNYVLLSTAYHHIHEDYNFQLIPLFEKLVLMFTLKTDHHVIFQKDEQLILLICEST